MARNVTYSCDICGLDNISHTNISHTNINHFILSIDTMDICSACCVLKLRSLLYMFHIDPHDWIKDRKKLDNG